MGTCAEELKQGSQNQLLSSLTAVVQLTAWLPASPRVTAHCLTSACKCLRRTYALAAAARNLLLRPRAAPSLALPPFPPSRGRSALTSGSFPTFPGWSFASGRKNCAHTDTHTPGDKKPRAQNQEGSARWEEAGGDPRGPSPAPHGRGGHRLTPGPAPRYCAVQWKSHNESCSLGGVETDTGGARARILEPFTSFL